MYQYGNKSMRIKISILYIVFFCCSFLFAQELSNDEQVEQLESQSAEYLVTKIFNYNNETRFFHYPYEKSGDNFFVREGSDNYEQSNTVLPSLSILICFH